MVRERSLERFETANRGLKAVNQYSVERLLGKGTFGAAYSAVDDDKRERVAIKMIEKGELRKKMHGYRKARNAQSTAVTSTVLKEIAVMKRVQHPNCVRLFEVIDDPKGGRIFMVMELLLGGEVMAEDNLPVDQPHLSEAQARAVFRDLLNGLEYLHGNGILHRDIKPENLAYSERPLFGRWREKPLPSERGGVGTSLLNAATAAKTKAVVGVTGGIADAGSAIANMSSGAGKLTTKVVSSVADAVSDAGSAAMAKTAAATGVVGAAATSSDAGKMTSALLLAPAIHVWMGIADAGSAVGTAVASTQAAKVTTTVLSTSVAATSKVGKTMIDGIADAGSAVMEGMGNALEEAAGRQVPPVKLLDFGISIVSDVGGASGLPTNATAARSTFDDSILKVCQHSPAASASPPTGDHSPSPQAKGTPTSTHRDPHVHLRRRRVHPPITRPRCLWGSPSTASRPTCGLRA